MTLQVQLTTFVMMIFSGLLIGYSFDTYKAFGLTMKLKKRSIIILDISFSIFITFLVFNILRWSNSGEFRVSILVLIFLGILLYFKFLSRQSFRIICIIVDKLFQLVKFVLSTLHKIIIVPVCYLYNVVKSILKSIYDAFYKIICFILRPITTPMIKLYNKAKIIISRFKNRDDDN